MSGIVVDGWSINCYVVLQFHEQDMRLIFFGNSSSFVVSAINDKIV